MSNGGLSITGWDKEIRLEKIDVLGTGEGEEAGGELRPLIGGPVTALYWRLGARRRVLALASWATLGLICSLRVCMSAYEKVMSA